MSKEQLRFDQDDIKSVIDQYKRTKKLKFDRMTSSPPREWSKEKKQKFSEERKQEFDKYRSDLEILRLVIINGCNSRIKKKKRLIRKFPNREPDDPISKRIKELQNEIKEILLWADENNENLPESIKRKSHEISDYPDEYPYNERYTGDWGDSIAELAKDLRSDTRSGVYISYEKAYRWAEKQITVKGKQITRDQLRNNYYKTKSSNPDFDPDRKSNYYFIITYPLLRKRQK